MTRALRVVASLALAMGATLSCRATPPADPGAPAGQATTPSIPAEPDRRQVTRVEPSAPRLAAPAELTPAEQRYGVAPEPDPTVTYQPDVVLVGGGAESVRGVSPNGIEWTIDRKAARAADLAAGKIMFLTGRAVGRVLAVREQNDTLTVVLGPADITEIIRDCDLTLEQPVDFAEMLQYAAPEFPGTSTPVDPIVEPPPPNKADRESGYGIHRADWRPANPPYRRIAAQNAQVGKFNATLLHDTFGLGIQLVSDGGVRMVARVKLHLNAPRLRFDLKIVGGRLQRAELVLQGAAGLTSEFESASAVGLEGNINERGVPAIDLSLPIIGMAVPVAVNVRQQFIIQTAFSAKGALKARGAYSFSGGFSVGYRDGAFRVGGPTGLSTRESLLQSIDGVSLGVTGLVLAHQVKVITGIGAFGFVTGPYVGFNSSVAVSRHSDLDTLARCRGATLTINMSAGVGYVMPQPVTNAINWFLRGLNLGEIKGEGGMESPRMEIVNAHATTPQSKACGA